MKTRTSQNHNKTTEARPKQRPPKRGTTPEYTEAQKIAAVTALHEVGGEHPTQRSALDAARRVLGAPVAKATLARWSLAYGSQIRQAVPELFDPQARIARIAEATHETIVNDFSEVRRKALDKAQTKEKIDAASFRDLMVGAGIASDHIAKLTGLAPEAVMVIRSIESAARQRDLDYITLLNDLKGAIEAQPITQGNQVVLIGKKAESQSDN